MVFLPYNKTIIARILGKYIGIKIAYYIIAT